MIPNTVTLENQRALLRPLQLSDVVALQSIAFEPSIWQWSLSHVYDVPSLEEYIQKGMNTRCAFLIFDKLKNRAAGSTSYLNIVLEHNRLEIGSTWIGVDFQRTGLNRACKALLLQYAFETLGCQRVELKTDSRNHQSRTAMEAMGAKYEGILRSHMAVRTGRRDTVYYSILLEEWKDLKEGIFREWF